MLYSKKYKLFSLIMTIWNKVSIVCLKLEISYATLNNHWLSDIPWKEVKRVESTEDNIKVVPGIFQFERIIGKVHVQSM